MDNLYKKKISETAFDAFELEWDTQYFNVNSARAILKKAVSKEEQNRLYNFIDKYKFVTIINKGNRSENNILLGGKEKTFLTDVNIQFAKEINEKKDDYLEFLNVFSEYERDEKVINLAKNAFKYSRFFNDPNLLGYKSRNIYSHWVESAFEKKDRFFVILKSNNELAGFLLFSINLDNSNAKIELIAVDENYQGINIGKKLMACFESYVYSRGIKFINVGTQIENIRAIRFYLSQDYKVVDSSTVYHYWP